jgi:hypothetical protein
VPACRDRRRTRCVRARSRRGGLAELAALRECDHGDRRQPVDRLPRGGDLTQDQLVVVRERRSVLQRSRRWAASRAESANACSNRRESTAIRTIAPLAHAHSPRGASSRRAMSTRRASSRRHTSSWTPQHSSALRLLNHTIGRTAGEVASRQNRAEGADALPSRCERTLTGRRRARRCDRSTRPPSRGRGPANPPGSRAGAARAS